MSTYFYDRHEDLVDLLTNETELPKQGKLYYIIDLWKNDYNLEELPLGTLVDIRMSRYDSYTYHILIDNQILFFNSKNTGLFPIDNDLLLCRLFDILG